MADKVTNLYNTRAHVFQVNPETKNTWLTKGDSVIPVSFVSRELPTGRRELRIIGTNDDNETVLDSVISPVTDFKKRAPKFGQWTDPVGMTYGVGFNSELELDTFISIFQQLQGDSVTQVVRPTPAANVAPNQNQPQPQGQVNNTNLPPSANQIDRLKGTTWRAPTNNSSEINGRDQPPTNGIIGRVPNVSADIGAQLGPTAPMTQKYPSNAAQMGHAPVRRVQQVPLNNGINAVGTDQDTNNNGNNVNANGNGTRYPRSQSMFGMSQVHAQPLLQQQPPQKSTTPDETLPAASNDWHIRDQLKYENERLKQALEESSKNAGIWQNELANLRTNNAKLTQALQESKAHVGEWEKELFGLRDENKELKLRVMVLESADDPEKAQEYQKELDKYKSQMNEVQKELRRKENELEELQESMERLKVKTNSVGPNARLLDESTLAEAAISSYQKQKFDSINSKFDVNLRELQDIQKEYAQLADKLYH